MKAFPRNATTSDKLNGVYDESGMDLRDYFACHAMQAYISTLDNIAMHGFNSDFKSEEICEKSYNIADAMMEARDA